MNIVPFQGFFSNVLIITKVKIFDIHKFYNFIWNDDGNECKEVLSEYSSILYWFIIPYVQLGMGTIHKIGYKSLCILLDNGFEQWYCL